jgi:hypothetical protein
MAAPRVHLGPFSRNDDAGVLLAAAAGADIAAKVMPSTSVKE